ncbi:MAG: hypothetical protein WBD86_00705 [Microgenomates group bacterium]
MIFIANYPGKIGYLANRLTGIPIPGIPEEELVHIPEERDLLSILSAQKGVYEGDVSIVGNLDIPLTTNTKDLIVSSSATINKLSVSSGLVVAGNEIINSSGKIPAINGYYFEDSSGENLTNVNAHHLNGVAASSFLRSDQSDTAEGAINFTASPGSTDVSGGPVYINPASTTSNYTLLGIAVGGTQKFKIDAEGDIIIEGSLSVAGISTLTGNVTFSGRGLFSHGANQGLNLPTNTGVPSAVTGTTESDIVYDTSGDTLYIYDGASFTAIKGLFTDGGTITYLTSTTDNLALGGTDSSAPFFMNVSTGNLTITGGLTAGSGSVGIIDSSGKIPAISSTYLTNLSGANLTSIDATTLDSTDSTSFLRSDTSDGFTSGTLSFSDGTFLDLSSILHDDVALQGLRLPQNTSFSAPTSGEGFLAWDTDDKKLFAYNGSSWSEIGEGLLTDGGAITYLTSTTDDLAVGGTDSSAPFFMNVPAGNLTITGGLTAGSGSVGIVDSSGKISAISSTYFANLSGTNLTSVNATTLDSIDSISFLRSDTSDSFTSGTLTLSDGTFLDLSSIVHDDVALQGLRLPQNTSLTAPTSGEGFIAWDTDDKKLFAYNGSSWSEIGGGLFTDGGAVTYLTSQTDDVAFGGTDSSAPFFFNESTELLTLTNITAGDSFRVNDVASDTTPFLIDTDGKVGIGTTDPGYELDVSGSINFTGSLREDGVEIFSGMIAPFAGDCPTGWTEYTAARGRTVVGVPDGGSVAGTVGTALTNLGTRTITDVPSHRHGITAYSLGTSTATISHLNNNSGAITQYTHYTGSASVDVTMPYIQLRYCQKSAGSDFAEWIPSDEDLQPESVVSIDPYNDEKVVSSKDEYDSSVVGIIATEPGWLIGDENEESVQMALSGRVPTKVSIKNGFIKRGDPITTSTIPGGGMLATKEGSIVGKAMEALDETSSLIPCFDESTGKWESCGTIKVFVNISWYDPETDQDSLSTQIAQSDYLDDLLMIYDTVEEGDVVDFNYHWAPASQDDPTLQRKGEIRKTISIHDPLLIGVISNSKGELLRRTRINHITLEEIRLITLGIAEVKISPESKDIKEGDAVTSFEDGKAVKAVRAGTILGRALENWSPETGRDKIKVYVDPSWYDPGVYLTDTGDFSIEKVPGTEKFAVQNTKEDSPVERIGVFSETIIGNLKAGSIEVQELKLGNQTFSADTSADFEHEIASMSARINNLETELLLLNSSSLTTEIPEATSSSLLTSLTVLGDSVLGDTVINGKLNVGILSFDNLTGSIDAIGPLKLQSLALGSIELAGGSIEIDQSGNLDIKKGVVLGNEKFRGNAILTAGETFVQVEKEWEETPTSITITPSYNTVVWVTEKSDKGFIVHVNKAPTEDQALDWLAIW